MVITQYVNHVFNGNLFEDCLYDYTEEYDKPYFNYGYPWGMVYFRIDTETIIAYGCENERQSPRSLLKKVKDYHFEVDFTIKPKLVETDFGMKWTYYAKKVDVTKKNRNLSDFPNLN
ncbi:MAG: hypothetical protein FJZ67_06705 [Bacteroidetes bacterium]|nr:hypothetical protein [Bacteroidota bacterium]